MSITEMTLIHIYSSTHIPMHTICLCYMLLYENENIPLFLFKLLCRTNQLNVNTCYLLLTIYD